MTLAEFLPDLRTQGRYQRAKCPFHKERTASFTVFASGRYQCFGCGASGWVDDLLGNPVKTSPQVTLREPPKVWPALDWATFTLEARENDAQSRLSAWRGYPERFCEWLIEHGHVGMHDGQFAFPIRQMGRIVRAHVRRDERIDWKARGEQPFFYYPTIGSSVDAMIIRLTDDAEWHIHEGQWDCFAAMSQIKRGSWIATRGACNAAKLGRVVFSGTVYLWPQNDDAGQSWAKACRAMIQARCAVRVVAMPDGCKDANDYLRAGKSLRALVK